MAYTTKKTATPRTTGSVYKTGSTTSGISNRMTGIQAVRSATGTTKPKPGAVIGGKGVGRKIKEFK